MSSRSGRGKRKLASGDGSGFEAWGGYMAAKIQKLQNQFREDTPGEGLEKGPITNIFKGISIFVNGYTKPSSAELKTLMMQHGGTYHHYYQRQLVTHIIANNLPNSKIMNLTDKKVVSPNWISESIKAGKLLSYEDFLLYTNRSKTQPGMNKFAVKISKEDSSSISSYSSTSTTEQSDDIQTLDSVSPTNERTRKTEGQSARETPTACNSSTRTTSSVSMSESNIKHTAETSPKIRSNQSDQPSNALTSDTGPRSIGDARDPNFLSEFFSNSRLHHISTWGAEYKAYVSRLHASGDTSFPGRDKLRQLVSANNVAAEMLSGKPRRVIMHVDMDCFFVSVGLRKRPDLIGKPVAVTHSKGKGKVREREGTDISYEVSHWGKKGLKLRSGPGKGKLDPAKMDLDGNLDLEDLLDDCDGDVPTRGSVSSNAKSNEKPVTETFNSMSEIASCNYEARKAGVKNGMFMGGARSLCPNLETIPYDFEGYREVSQLLYDTVASFTHDIEAVSCDEMFVDCTDLLADTGASPLQLASLLRQLIKEKTDCHASVGIGPNILLARMATRVAKPNGQHQLQEEEALAFLKDKSVRDLPGVGRAMTNKFATLKVGTCGDLQLISLQVLQKEFGPKTGQLLHRYCRGQDDRPIKCEQERKSVSAEVNYGIRFKSESDVERFITELAGEVSSRLQKLTLKGKTITLKLKVRAEGAPKETAKFLGHGICDNVAKSSTIPLPTDNALVIAKEVMGILRALRIPPAEHRGVGIQVSRLEAPVDRRSSSSRGNQSILNFAIKAQPALTTTSPKNKTAPHPTAKPSDNQKLPTLQDSDHTIRESHDTSDEVRVESTGQPSEIDYQNSETPVHNEEPVSGPSSGDPHSPGVLEGHIEESDHRGKDVGRSEQKSGQSISNNVERVFRSKTSVILPRLPKLPSFLSPSPTHRRPRPMSSETPPAPDLDDDILLPSPSQVDPEVLQALPDDIRQQIEGAMAAKRSDRQTRSSTRSQTLKSGDPPPRQASNIAHSSSSGAASTYGGGEERPDTSRKKDEAIVALPSPSQLDPTCLDALPPELREELLQAYKREGQGQSQPRAVPQPSTSHQPPLVHPLMLQKNQKGSPNRSPGKTSPGKRSPGKQTSPSRKLKTSPVFKKPRGKGPGRPRKKLNFGKSSARITETRNIQQWSESGISPQPSTSEPEASASREEVAEASSSNDDVTKPPEGVHLCGAVTLAEVKDLVKEWTLSSDAPEEEDVLHLTRYLRELVADLNLERLHLVLLYLRRCLKKRPHSAEWETTYQEVVNEAQAIIESTYGSRLNL